MLMQKSILLSATVVFAVVFSGCCCGPYGGCGPVGAGIGGGCVTDCNDCDGGTCSAGRPMVYGPLQHLAQMRKSLVCGGGCGEVYYGEWQSTPPDACDPCCGDQFVGGAVPCNPFCWTWRPGQLFYGFFGGLYGQRFCHGCGNDFGSCGCGSVVDSGCGCDAAGGSTAGCATCNSSSAVGPQNRIAAPPQPQGNSRTARSAMQRGVSSRYAKPPTRYR